MTKPAAGPNPSAALVRDISRVTWAGAVVNVLLTALKGVFGYLAGSRALMADAVHSFSDLLSDAAILIGVRFWTAPPDEGHPYGHRKIETVVTLLLGLSLGLVGLVLAYQALVSLYQGFGARAPAPPPAGPLTSLALAIALISLVSKEILYRWTVARGLALGSPALVANAWHHRSDALSSIPPAVTLGVAVLTRDQGYDLWFLDPVGAVVVCAMLLKAAWEVAGPAFSALLDRGADERFREALLEAVYSTPGVASAHKVRTRCLCPGAVEVDLHVLVRESLTVRQGHDIATEVKKRLLALAVAGVDARAVEVIVHVEPDE